jgi:hypothetical protein
LKFEILNALCDRRNIRAQRSFLGVTGYIRGAPSL